MYRKDVKRSKLYMRWILEREENGKNWKRIGRIGRDRKIGNSDFIDSVGDNLLPTHT